MQYHFWGSQYVAAIEVLWHFALLSLSVDVNGNEAQFVCKALLASQETEGLMKTQ